MVNKICEVCGKEFSVIPCREKTAKYCSRKCSDAAWKTKRVLNVTCSQCGTHFHMKESQKNRYNRTIGVFCSKECLDKYRKVWFQGKNNHQYGLRGELNCSFKGQEIPRKNHNLVEIEVYAPNHPYANRNGRVLKHRIVVEANHEWFNPDAFEVVKGVLVLKKEYQVHHIDGNHNNNDISNLMVLTRGEHTALHNRDKVILRDAETGRITGVIKRGELLGSPINGDNQQPSSQSAESSGKVQRLTGEQRNNKPDTSAPLANNSNEDIVWATHITKESVEWQDKELAS